MLTSIGTARCCTERSTFKWMHALAMLGFRPVTRLVIGMTCWLIPAVVAINADISKYDATLSGHV